MIKFFIYIDNNKIIEAGRSETIPANSIEISKDEYVEYINGNITNETHHIVNGNLLKKGQSAITPFSNKFKEIEDVMVFDGKQYIVSINFDNASITEQDNPNILYEVVNKGVYTYNHPVSVWAIL